ncbi:MAG: DUF2333 family protein [Prevotellaceae bacterium]|nr:DUF2333 family protein [Prevotellaceae bacterium]
MENIKMPDFSPNLFWDTDIADLDMEKHKKFIVNRVLDYGSWDDWKIIRDYYGLIQVRDIAKDLREMFAKSLSFISTITQTPEDQFRCYKLLQSKDTHWSY